MHQVILLAALGLASAAVQAGRPYLELSATSPTSISAGGWVNFQLSFSQIQENGSMSGSGGGEPSADVGLQTWHAAFDNSWTDRLTGLALQMGATGGPQTSQGLAPDAAPGTDYRTTWNLRLSFDKAGSFQVRADATVTQDKTRYASDTLGTRECVGFDNSVQCTDWVFDRHVREDSAWTEITTAASLPMQIQVQAVPEPATLALWLLGGGLLGWRLRRR